MHWKNLLAFILSCIGLALATPSVASVQCALPYTLTNGAPADATQVMANFNALVTCLASIVPAGTTNAIQYNGGRATLQLSGP
jgi:hypothetical protein